MPRAPRRTSTERPTRLGAVLATLPAAVTVLVLAGVIAWGITHLGFLRPGHRTPFVTWTCIAWAVFVLGVLLLRAVPRRAVAAVVLGGAVVVGVAALAGPPDTSSDSARYAWDGIVQLHGLSPYAHTPSSHVLAGIRPDWLFGHPTPHVVQSPTGPTYCPGDRIQTAHDTATDARLCTPINRPSVPTIYPPMAELWFALVRSLVAVTATYWPMQVAGLAVSLGVTVGLLLVLRRARADLRWAALWAWCPLVASEAVTNSHVDVLGAALVTVGAVLVAFGRPVWGGIALGAATSTKLIPAIAYPALLGRRRSWWALLVGVAVFAVLYVPYVATTGLRVLGYLPGYLSEEGYDDGSRFALVSLVAHGNAAIVVVGVVVLLTAVVAWRVADPARPWSGEVLVIGVTLLAVSPRYPWYALLLVPFVVLSGRWEWLAVGLAITVRQLHPSVDTFRWTLAAAAALVLVGTLVRTPRSDWVRWRARLSPERHAPVPGGSDPDRLV
ncbi:glycosyltransferase family 87 protein [Curtobacterium sp. MCBD17_035]|uniref:glycosyltransferase family 87 protein n=1 Tax=Curtobacterium sp. MCBD17_035 TaxID=2175673 RepID=UPI000DAA8DFE|nr:glycosyltransferase family 87 protein [Curtobacterium sp. MCBD17_035]WIB66880.1 glycosyltransferase family 87 protein [Curtobacterium sp. MCBD17_035]